MGILYTHHCTNQHHKELCWCHCSNSNNTKQTLADRSACLSKNLSSWRISSPRSTDCSM